MLGPGKTRGVMKIFSFSMKFKLLNSDLAGPRLISVPAVREVAGGDQSRRQKNLGQNGTYWRSLTSGAIRPQGVGSSHVVTDITKCSIR